MDGEERHRKRMEEEEMGVHVVWRGPREESGRNRRIAVITAISVESLVQ